MRKMLKIFRNADISKRYTEISLKGNEKYGDIIKLEGFENIVSGGYYGGAQEWYRQNREVRAWDEKRVEKASDSGCGFVSVANSFAYYIYKNNKEAFSNSKEEFKLITLPNPNFRSKIVGYEGLLIAVA